MRCNVRMKLFYVMVMFVFSATVAVQAESYITPVAATASTNLNLPAGNTINSSGWPGDGTHSVSHFDMWLSANGVVGDQWITFDLGAEYDLTSMSIWNENQVSPYNGRGIKLTNVLVAGVDEVYTDLGEFTFAIAPGNATTDFEDIHPLVQNGVRFVKFDITSNHNSESYVGLSEVRFSGTLTPNPSASSYLTPIAATATSAFSICTPAQTINSSGWPGDGTHSTNFAYMWLSNAAVAPVSEQELIFDLGAEYDLVSMSIWNHNQTGYHRGIQDANVLVAGADEVYTDLGQFTFVEAPGDATTDFEDIHPLVQNGVRYVKLDIQSNFSGGSDAYVGLSEVRFTTVPPLCETYLGSDLNMDCTVDEDDLYLLAEEWLEDPENGFMNYMPQGFQAGVIADPNVPFAAIAPVIDGVLSENEWDNAAVIEVIWPDIDTAPKDAYMWAGTAPASATDFSSVWYLKWDTSNLYVAISVYDSTPAFINVGPYNSQDVMQFEFDLLRSAAGDAALYDIAADNAFGDGFSIARHIYNGVGFANTAFTSEQSAAISGQSALVDGGYIIEAALPWSVLDISGSGYTPTINDLHSIGFLNVDIAPTGSVNSAISVYTDPFNPASWQKIKLIDGSSAQQLSWPWNTGSKAYRLLNYELNGDLDVNLVDLAVMASEWMQDTITE